METTKLFNVCLLDSNGNPSKIYIFSNGKKIEPNILFSESQINDFNLHNPEFIYVDQYIYKDDSIKIIKRKILKILEKYIDNITFEQLYLFSQTSVHYNTYTLFKKLCNSKNTIDNTKYQQFLLNINKTDNNNKNDVTIDDFIDLDLPNKLDVFYPLGKDFSSYFDFLFSGNPFNVLDTVNPTFINENSNNTIITADNNLLFEYNLNSNIIYLSLISDIFTYCNTNKLNEEYFIKVYFDYLRNEQIFNSKQLDDNINNLLKKQQNKTSYDKYNKQIDLFYDIYYNNIKPINYLENGVNNISLYLLMNNNTSLPLDSIFKILHTSKNIPLIKFNPGKRKENMYRIFSDKITKTGKKVPFLNKNLINILSKTIGKGEPQISFYNIIKILDEDFVVIIDLLENSNFKINIKCNHSFDVTVTDNVINKTINPIIQNINSFIESFGYNINYFKSINSNEIKVINIDIFKSISQETKFNFSKYSNFISSIFDIIDNDNPNYIRLNYTRVSNYKKMNGIYKFIHNHYNGENHSEVISKLVNNLNITEDEARDNVNSFRSEVNMINGRYSININKIIENPGFNSEINVITFEDKISFNIQQIDSFHYIEQLNIYIDSIFRILQYYESIKIPEKKLKDLLNKKVEQDIIQNELPIIIAPIVPIVTEEKQQEQEAKPIKINIIQDEILGNVKDNIYDNIDDDDDEDDDDDDDDGIFFDDDDDNDDDTEFQGGSKKTEDNLIGMPLKKPNMFYDRLVSREPKLFLTKKTGKFNAYSRLCQHNSGKQPIILTDEEKNYIDEKYPGSYNKSIKYGTNPDKQYNYICPRYWCLLTNSPITQEDVEKGKCGKIIPDGEKKVPKGHYVIQFRKDTTELYPGFLSQKSHPENKCIPCCFKGWDSPEQKRRRQECTGEDLGADNKRKANKPQYNDTYIISFDSYPVAQHRFGFLDPSIEKFLNEDYTEKVNKVNSHQILPDKWVLLRYGTELHKTQSFVGVLSEINKLILKQIKRTKSSDGEQEEMEKTDSISEFKEKIIKSLNIDLFLRLQNGSLVNVFKPKEMIDVDINPYVNSNFYKKLDNDKEEHIDFFKQVILSYENFKKYLRDDDVIIDHTYLWDFSYLSDSKLFDTGINIILLEKTNNDMTDNFELICPTNAYSSILFDHKKPAVIILKRDNYYELVVNYKLASNKKENNSRLAAGLYITDPDIEQYKDTIFKIIGNLINNKCKPIKNSTIKNFKQNKSAYDIYDILIHYNYEIKKQVLNYQGKCIGFVVNKDLENNVYIPTYPSKLFKNMEITFFDDLTIYNDYQYTIESLKKISNDTNKDILCLPDTKVLEDNLIVGILTETNQFIQINSPTEDIHNDDLDVINSSNYIKVDKTIFNNDPEEEKRLKIYNNIKLETLFFNAFRNTIKILLNHRSVKDIRKQITIIINNESILYKEKLKTISEIIKNITSTQILFVDNYDSKVLDKIHSITNCYTNGNKKTYCLFDKTNGSIKLLIPKKHLISNMDNEQIYYNRISDELLRYESMKNFILDPESIVSLGNIDYDINKNEFILIHSNLQSGDYFDYEEVLNENEYSEYLNYEFANPQNVPSEITNIPLVEEDQLVKSDLFDSLLISIDCIKKGLNINEDILKTDNDIWRKYFINTKEYYFRDTPYCSFTALRLIIYFSKNIKLSVNRLKQILIDKYSIYFNNDKYKKIKEKILHILKEQGKGNHVELIKTKSTTIEKIIIDENYYLTDLDILAIVSSNEININVIIYSNDNFNTMNPNINWLLISNKDKQNNLDVIKDKKYWFIRTPNFVKNNMPPAYSIINKQIPLKDIDIIANGDFNEFKKNNILNFDTFLKDYVITGPL